MQSHVIKIKPPMCFTEADAKRLLSALGDAMGEVQQGV
jgi:4-aminobutyrate aminotransferase-like enzyme